MIFDSVRTIGHWVIEAVQAVGQMTLLLYHVLQALWRSCPRRAVFIQQFYQVGFLSLPIVILTGVSIGLVLAVQAYATLRPLASENMTGAMVNFAMVTELAPVFTGIMLAGRVGSAIAAEIGTMKVTEQLDALRVMGTDPIAYLVAPRFTACIILLPALSAINAYAGIFGAQILAIHIWGIDAASYHEHAQWIVETTDILSGQLKTIFFGGIIALVACRKGLLTEGGATGVGISCTEGVVTASSMILMANFVLTVLFQTVLN